MHCPRFSNPEHVSFKFAPVGKSPFECKFDVSVLFSFVLLSSSVLGELGDARFDPFIVDPRSVMLPLFPRAVSRHSSPTASRSLLHIVGTAGIRLRMDV